PERARLHVVADERLVLVKAGRVLLDEEGDFPLRGLAAQPGERSQAKRAEHFVQVRSADRHTSHFSLRGLLPLAARTPVGDSGRVTLAARKHRLAAPRAG